MERRGGGAAPAELELPGFRFHPTEEELLEFYLKQVAHGKKLKFDIISTVHLYRHDPWELPGLARIAGAEREWYFFVPRDHRKQHGGGRTSRTTERGFWKATGSDRAVRCAGDPKRLIGLRKTLVYYEGRAPRGSRTDWVMNEYRLPNKEEEEEESVGVVLCKVYRKAVSLKELEQRAAMEELACAATATATATPSSASHNSTGSGSGSGSPADSAISSSSDVQAVEMKKEAVVRPAALMSLPQLEVARQPPQQMAEWMQDPFLTQLRSPWMESWSPYYGASSVLNF